MPVIIVKVYDVSLHVRKNSTEYVRHKTHSKKYHLLGINEPPYVKMKSIPGQHLPPLPPLPFYTEPDSSKPEEQPHNEESLREEEKRTLDTNLSSDISNKTTEYGFEDNLWIPTNRPR